MRAWSLLGLALFLVVLGVAHHAQASTVCHATGNWCQGYSTTSTTTGGVASARCFAVRTTNTAPTCSTTAPGITPVNEGTWEANAGGCVTIYYFDTTTGAVPPAAPNKVTLTVRFDNSATNIITFLNAVTTEPANGSSYSFCATSDGVTGSSARAGTYRIFLNPVKDNGPGGVGNYNINSDGGGTPLGSDQGALRGDLIVSSVARNAYPSGSMFAYGPSGDETLTITGTFTQPNGDNNVETLRTCASTASLCAELGASTDIDATTTLAQNFVVDNTYSNAAYVPVLIIGASPGSNSLLTGIAWTRMAPSGHGATIVRDSDTVVHDSTTFNVDPRIKMDSDGSGGFGAADETDKSYLSTCTGSLVELFNKGESVCHEWYLYNARDQLLSRAMTHARLDSANTQCASYGSLTPTSNKYTKTDTLGTGGTCLSAADTTGSTRHLLVTNTDQSYSSGTIFFVSSLLRFDQDGTGAPDNLALTCYGASGCPTQPATVMNRGERVDYETYLITARGTQYCVSGVLFKSYDSTPTQTDSQTINAASCKYNAADFALTSSEKATADTTGDPHTFQATKDGNTATTGTNYGVSSLYFTDSHIQLSGTLVHDDYPTENSAEDTAYIISTAVTDTTHGWCHVKGVRKDVNIDTSGSAVTWSYLDPTPTTRLSGTTDTGADGWTATHLDLLASTPLGTWTWRCTVSFNGNSATNDQTFTVSVPAGTGGGFPGDPIRLFCSPVMAWTGQNVRCTITESLLDGTARTGNAASTDIDIRNDAQTGVVSDGHPTEWQFGTYYYDYTPTTAGSFHVQVRTTDITTSNPIGGSAVFYVAGSPTATAADLAAAVTTLQGSISSAVTTIDGHTDTALTTLQTDLTTIKGYTDQVEGYTDTLEASASSAATDLTTIKGYTDSVEGTLSALDTQADTYHANETAFIAETHDDVHEIQTAISNLNMTVTGNFTVDNATLTAINSLLIEKLGPPGEPMEISHTLLLFWIVAFLVMLRASKLISAAAASLGVVVSAFNDWGNLDPVWQAAAFGVLAITLWLEALGRDKIILAFFNPDMKQKQLTE